LVCVIKCVGVVAEACVIGNVLVHSMIGSETAQMTHVASLWCIFANNKAFFVTENQKKSKPKEIIVTYDVIV
jgi:hypothetical protein